MGLGGFFCRVDSADFSRCIQDCLEAMPVVMSCCVRRSVVELSIGLY
jgi:hypothetical protein